MTVLARLLFPVVASLAVVPLASCATSPVVSFDDSLRSADAQLDQLRPVLRRYPPNLSNSTQRGEVEDRWRATEATLVALQRSNPDEPRVLLRLGELYRFGHNLDVPGAGERCVSTPEHLISIDPSNVGIDHNITGFSRISFTEPTIPASGRWE